MCTEKFTDIPVSRFSQSCYCFWQDVCQVSGGWICHSFSVCFKNSGPNNQFFASLSIITDSPIVAGSAGFINPGTHGTCSSLRYCLIYNTLFFTNTCNALVLTLSQSCTALESVHKWMSLCCMSRVATSFLVSAKPISAANNSMRGIV
jgi:hypothetical protein